MSKKASRYPAHYYEDYDYEGIDYGYVSVNADGSTDGDYTYHDAEVTLYLGWNII